MKNKLQEWLKRYIPAEILGTCIAITTASIVYSQTHSYVIAAASGWIGEGIGFFGYCITTQLVIYTRKNRRNEPLSQVIRASVAASRNLIIEFLPAELIDNFLIRPFAMFIVPQYVHPYPIGFLLGKIIADIFFYIFAIAGYELQKRITRKER